MYGVPQKKSACSGNMPLFTICVCYKAYLLETLTYVAYTNIISACQSKQQNY